MSATTTQLPTRNRIPSAPWLIGAVYVLSVVFSLAFISVAVIFDLDPNGRSVPLDELANISTFGTAALALGVLPGLYLAKTPARSRVGAIVYGALALLTVVFFWSGAPGVLGAVAAWLGGLTRGRVPERGAARIFAIIGLCVAILNCVMTVVGITGDAIAKWF